MPKLPSPELLAPLAAITGAIAVIARKILARKSHRPKTEYITRAEFHHGLDLIRDRIAASYLAVADKLKANQREIEHRLDRLDTAVARLDERTTFHP